MRPINTLIVHCADTPPNMDCGAKEIDSWHKERGWTGIGYHYVIRRDGSIEYGREVSVPGAHVRGHNTDSIGVCLIGGKGGFNFTPLQMSALSTLMVTLKNVYPDAQVKGHRDLDPGKDCPTFDAAAVIDPAVNKASAWRGTGLPRK